MSATALQKRLQKLGQQPLPSHSTAITHAGYDHQNQILALVFRGNPDCVYLYQNISAVMADRFEQAESKGTWYDRELRPYFSLYPFTKVAVVNEVC